LLAQRAAQSRTPCVRGGAGMLITDIRCALMEFVASDPHRSPWRA
jgi:hypothetical protein